jgi:hypothetical protein
MNTLEQATARFAKLPTDFQEAIRHFDYDKRLSAIHQKFKLHIDQSFALEKAVGDVIFGDIHSTEMHTAILHGLHVTKEQADEISMEINNQILLPIREAIKLVQQDEK